jgi:hypothetical protein
MKWLSQALLLLCWFVREAGGDMSPMQFEKLERFKKRIDFDTAISREKTQQAVNSVWPEMLKAPGLNDGEWSVAADSIWRADGGIAREWVLRRGMEQISIVIFAASDDPAAAQNFFLSRATENMMLDSPFVKGPDGLGSLAASMPPGAQPNLLWVFRNLCFDVRSDNSPVDIVAIARWLQTTAEAGVVASTEALPHAPGPLYLSSRRAEVGELVDVQVRADKPEAEARYMVELEFDRNAVEVVSQDKLASQLRGRIAGYTAVTLYLIDKATLTSAHTRIELEFIPAVRK